jgi:effector-binding domain-containing protein
VPHEVEFRNVTARPTLVVSATTSWQEFPKLWKVLLDEVWACLRAAGITSGCRNVMLYRDDVPHVEVGVERADRVRLTGRVVVSSLPGGRVAMTVHRGPYAELGSAHQAVRDRCVAGRERLAGPRWEVYGPHRDEPAELWTEVYYLLS